MIENSKYMSPDEIRTNMTEINQMVKENPTRDDVKFYATA
jgi:hypothetical protein